MKYIFFLIPVILAGACVNMHSVKGSGNTVTEKRNVPAFTAIHAGGSVHVVLKNGTEQSVTVEADDNIITRVETEVSGNTLNIRLKEFTSLTDVTINVYVTAPGLTKLSASASAEIDSKDIISSKSEITLTASSSARVELAVDAPSVTAEAGSSGDIIVSGRTKSVNAKASSSGSVMAFGLLAENADADASSSGNIEIFGSVSINASASSSGDIKYTGGAPDVKKHESSSGSVSPE